MSRTRVVITGVGCISGLGKTVAETWKNVVDCRSAISPITTVDTTTVRFKNGADIKDYQSLDHFSPKQFDLIDKFSQFALIAAR